MLVGIFCLQAFAVVFSFNKCTSIAEKRGVLPVEVCPNLPDNFNNVTNVMIATVLSLLVGNKIGDK